MSSLSPVVSLLRSILPPDASSFDPPSLRPPPILRSIYLRLPPILQSTSLRPPPSRLLAEEQQIRALQQTVDRPPPSHQKQQGCTASDKRKGWKAEKNLRFLLQKVLKQSDIGRIVLPKKEAEMHLPELECRDGISIAMEDIETSRVWNMRYNSSIRFD
ncbi:Regulatory protein viviparous-1 [Linum perenne]